MAISQGSLGTVFDFWRSGAGLVFPDSVADTTEAIIHQGRVAVGAGKTLADGVAHFEIEAVTRSGVHGNTANTPLYVTGGLPTVAVSGVAIATTPVGGVEFRRSDGTFGVGFGYDGIYASGSNASQNLAFMQKGSGSFFFGFQAPNAGLCITAKDTGVALVVGQSITEDFGSLGSIRARKHSALVESLAPLHVRQQFDITSNGGLVTALRIAPSIAEGNGFTELVVGEQNLNNRKIVMWQAGVDAHQYYGFGVNADTLRYQVSGNSAFHRFYAGVSAAASRLLFSVSGFSRVTVDPSTLNVGDLTQGALLFGGEAATAGTSSKGDVGSGQNGLQFTTNNLLALEIRTTRRIRVPVMPTFATDAAAGVGGLISGELYKSPAGVVSIKL